MDGAVYEMADSCVVAFWQKYPFGCIDMPKPGLPSEGMRLVPAVPL